MHATAESVYLEFLSAPGAGGWDLPLLELRAGRLMDETVFCRVLEHAEAGKIRRFVSRFEHPAVRHREAARAAP